MTGRTQNRDLEATAREAWNLAFTYRHSPNWGKAVSAANASKTLLRAAHPRVRRLAAELWGRPPGDLCA